MKCKLYFLFVAFFTLLFTGTNIAQWQPTGPYGGYIYSITGNSKNLYVGTQYGVYESHDNGKNWRKLTPFIDSLDAFFDVMAIKTNGNALFAGKRDGLYKTIDEGISWVKMEDIEGFVKSIDVNGSLLIAGSEKGAYLSANNGQSWGKVAEGENVVAFLNSDIIVANDSGIFRSSDYGIKWIDITPAEVAGSGTIPSLVVNGIKIYATFSVGVFCSKDGGTNWEKIYPLSISTVICATNQKVCLGYFDGMYISTDSGSSWTQPSNNGLYNKFIMSIHISEDYIYAGTQGSGLFVSSDNGINWEPINNGLDPLYVNSISRYGTTLLAATGNEGLFSSYDYGKTWKNILAQNCRNVYSNDKSIYVLSGLSKTLFESTDGGHNWFDRGLPVGSIQMVQIGTKIFTLGYTGLTGTSGFIFDAEDSGGQYSYLFAPANISTLATSVNNLYAGSNDGKLYISTDLGLTWSLVAENLGAINTIFCKGEKIYTGGESIHKSLDGGKQFKSIYSRDGYGVGKILEYTDENKINYILACGNKGVIVSDDEGITWKECSFGLPENTHLFSAIIHVPNIYLAIQNGGNNALGIWYRPITEIINGSIKHQLTVKPNISDQNDPQKRPEWVSTGLRITVGDTLIIKAAGHVDDGGGYSSGPDGTGFGGDPNPNFPDWYNNVSHLALIGRIIEKDGKIIPIDDKIDISGKGIYGPGFIGSSFSNISDVSGILELSINDGDTFNNSGSYDVTIEYHPYKIPVSIQGDNKINFQYSLSQNYPNPFNPETTINYQISEGGHVTLKVYDILGREVAVLVNENQNIGEHQVKFNGKNLSSGIYFYCLQSNNYVLSKKMILIK